MNHLPECFWPDVPERAVCICDRLRACEQRLISERGQVAASYIAEGYAAGVQASRDAVAALIHSTMCDCESCWWKADALAAIDALKETNVNT